MVLGVIEGIVKLQQDGALRIYNTHLSAISPHDRIMQIDFIRDTIRRAPSEGGAWTGTHAPTLWQEDAAPPPMPESYVLLGDFNLEGKDPEYDHLAGPKDGDLGRLSSKEEFVDTWVAAGHDEDEGMTFFTDPTAGDAQGMRIDYAFVDESMRKRVVGARIDGAAQGSDHQPYWVELDYAPDD